MNIPQKEFHNLLQSYYIPLKMSTSLKLIEDTPGHLDYVGEENTPAPIRDMMEMLWKEQILYVK